MVRGHCALEVGQVLIHEFVEFQNAVILGNVSVVKQYLDAGINPDIMNPDSFSEKTPLHLAAENNQYAIAVLLVKAGANKEAKNVDGDSPLDIANTENFADIVKLLK